MAESVDDGRVYGTEGETSLQDIPDQVIDPWCDTCYDETGQKTEAGGFCPDCNSFLCQPCLKAHAKMPALRNHIIKRGVRMPKCQAEKPVKYHDCNIHAGNVNDHFCLNHCLMNCYQCIEDTHTLCDTGNISDLCKTLCSADVSNFRKDVSSIHNIIVSTNSALEISIRDIKNKRNQMIKEVQDLRDKTIAKIQDSCSEIIVKINEVSNLNLSNLAEQNLTLSDMSHWFDKTISDIDMKINAKFEPNLFIRIQEIAGHVCRYKNEAEDISKQLKKVDLSFSVGKEMSTFLSLNCQLGEVKDDLTQLDILQPIPEIWFPQSLNLTKKTRVLRKQDISQIDAKRSGTLDLRIGEDQVACDVYGIDLTSNGALLFTDSNNKKIKVLSPEKKILSFLTLSTMPSDITVVNKRTAVVSAEEGKLYVLNISDLDSLSIQRTVALKYCVSGIIRHCSGLLVVRFSKQQSVKMIDLEGKEAWSISADHSGQPLFNKPFRVRITPINNKKTIIVTDWGKNTLTLLDASNGKFIRTINVKGKGPHGLTVDNDGNVYVCHFYTKEICVWSSDLQQCKILLSGDELQGHPRAIFYNDATDTLYVSYLNNDTVDCFQLRYK